LFGIGMFKNPSMVLAVVLTVVLQLAVVYVPAAQLIFDTVAMPFADLAISVGSAVLVLTFIEAWKAIKRRGTRR
jgi:Ca2+-transporting ATPase